MTYHGDLLIPDYHSELDYCQCANFTTKNIAYCNPYGNKEWQDLWSFYSSKISPFLSTCHHLERMNPVGWMDCGQAIYEEDTTFFAKEFSRLTF